MSIIIIMADMDTHHEVIFKTQGFSVAILTDADSANLQALLENSRDYDLLISGEPPSPDAAREVLTDLPPGKTIDDKQVLGIFDQDQNLVGVLDLVREYPAASTWWIGLLLLDPNVRGQGLGEAIYQSFENWAAQSGAVEIGLGVVEENVSAFRFWKRLGFVLHSQKPHTFGRKEQVVLSMRRSILSNQEPSSLIME